jgi:glycosyltransferase involved in cell wall biosynthesis
MINIGYDIRPLQTAHKYRGIGRYCGDLLKALRRQDSGVAFSFLAFDNIAEDADKPHIPYKKLVMQTIPGDHNRYRNVARDLLGTAKLVKSLKPDVFHYQMQVAPLQTRVPSVVTVHDCIPAWLGRRGTIRKERLLFKLQARAARNTDAVITISRHSKNDIVRYMGIHPDKIYVVYPGISPAYKPVQEISAVRERYGLPERYLLYTGAVDYRKNPRGLLRIYKKYASEVKDPLPLVFVGKRDYFRAMDSYWREIGIGLKKARLIYTGYVDDNDMPGVYSGAEILVFPSLYEGFGFPLIEAMACGTPVIAYDNSSVTEVVGDSGVLIKNNEERIFAGYLSDLLTDDSLYREYVGKGLRRAGFFSWDKAARETLGVYKKVLK